MGASIKAISRYKEFFEKGLLSPGDHVMELGAQNFYYVNLGDEQLISDTVRLCQPSLPEDDQDLRTGVDKLCAGGTMSEFFKLCGMNYNCIDIFDSDGAVVVDLNKDDIPSELKNKFDLVTNFGTTEHILNQMSCFKAIHDLTAVGGLIYHDLPMSGYYYHGYFLYTPLFFNHLALANNYEVLYNYYSKNRATDPFDIRSSRQMAKGGWPDDGYHHAGIEFIFRKQADEEFKIPVEVGTSLALSKEFLKRLPDNAVLIDGTVGLDLRRLRGDMDK